ncbi:MAG: RluA family pseudouridine synthase [Clostridia bacterium]|nr:RluA family pseudouridine synthase [Clostridia bacterium]
MERFEYTVTPADEGLTLGRLARQRLGASAALLRQLKWVEDGIWLDGRPVFVNVLPRAGQVISLAGGREKASENIQPQQGPVNIAYEDELMLIADKPGGQPVHPSRGHEKDTLANYVAGLFESRGQPFVFRAINRLDRGTSGLLCIAKTKYSASLLGKALHEGRIRREYCALCVGRPQPPDGTIDLPLGHREGYGIQRCVDPNGQPAVTHYRTLLSDGRVSLLRLRLETGRTHQIRVHMAHLGHPLVGDFMYGEELPGFDRVALHSALLRVELPDRTVELHSPPPPCFGRFLDLSALPEGAMQGDLP